MNPVSSWLGANRVLVTFVHGLAFFAMGLAIALEARRPSKLKLVQSLWLLAAFAFLQGLAQWAEMFLLIQRQVDPVGGHAALETIPVLLFPLSALFLIEFGVISIVSAGSCRWRLQWAPLALLSLWLVAIIQAVYSLCGLGMGWLWAADVWARYTLFLPGCILSAIALLLHSRSFREMKLPQIANYCIGAAVAFGVTAVLSGLIVAPDPCHEAPFLNESAFLAAVGLPVHIFRAAASASIACSVVSILQVFEIEQKRQIEAATEQRFLVQQEALESQRRAREAVERWSTQLEDMLNTITVAIGRLPELTEVLDIALRKVLELTRLEMGWVFLVDEEAKELTLCTHRGLSCRLARGLDRLRFDEGLAGRVASSGEPIVVENVAEDPRLTRSVVKDEGLRFHASVPLKSKGAILGIMSLASCEAHTFSDQEVALLVAIGQQIGMAIENARLYEQAQRVAVLEERDRLGRELHDGLAQVVGYLLMQSRAAAAMLAAGQTERAHTQLLEMQRVAKDAYGEVREAILGLRTTISPGAGLLHTLEEYLSGYSRQSGICARLVIDEGAPLELAPSAEIQLLRIIQEALTNVRRHAHAKHAWVRIGLEGEQASITVEDDGRGFEPVQPGQPRRHFGLQTMKERAQGVGGSLRVLSKPGQGTRVVVRLPISRRNGG
ncbi:MAG TPA: GAF domain-containing protein [Anaerolineae bacterium]|nr:GAF domain-containing protein [Anaerolineae bacterium]HOQ97667.1 GAF domain-containing protein [Anaerolineae bacterium]HPL29833.1 GAF domain-containing protein [Anaerolineae bacterium]